jgi:hypothetical protein
MRSTATDRFWKLYADLPVEVRKQAKEAYQLFISNSQHPGLQFKRVHSTRLIYSVRISIDFRALGIIEGDEITWFWIGGHAEYDNILKRLRRA